MHETVPLFRAGDPVNFLLKTTTLEDLSTGKAEGCV